MFSSDPSPLFTEIGDRSVAIIAHRYAERWRGYESTSGIYNVECGLAFVVTQMDSARSTGGATDASSGARLCRRTQVLATRATSTIGLERFNGVHVLEHPGAGVAPWNVEDYEIKRDPSSGRLISMGHR